MTQANPAELKKVVDVFVAEIDELESIFSTGNGRRRVVGSTYSYIPIEDGCLVALWDAWSRFLRYLTIASATGGCVGLAGGMYVNPTPRTETQVLADLCANSRRGRTFGVVNGEPKWYQASHLDDIVKFLQLSNGSTIIGAVSASQIQLGPTTVANPLEEVRICRNFVAHKAPTTLAAVRGFSAGRFVDLATHLRTMRSGIEAFSEWRDCFAALAEAAAQ